MTERPDAMSGSNRAEMRMTAVTKQMRRTGRQEKPGGNISMQLPKVRLRLADRGTGLLAFGRRPRRGGSEAYHDAAVRPPAHPGMHDRAAGNE